MLRYSVCFAQTFIQHTKEYLRKMIYQRAKEKSEINNICLGCIILTSSNMMGYIMVLSKHYHGIGHSIITLCLHQTLPPPLLLHRRHPLSVPSLGSG